MSPRFFLILLWWISILESPSWALERYRFERELMGTKFIVVCFGESETESRREVDEAFRVAEAFNSVATDYDSKSELSRLSYQEVGRPIPLSSALFDVLQKSRELAELTEGAFDPTLGTLTQLWRESKVSGRLPSQAQVREAREQTGWQVFELSDKDQTLTLHREGLRFDLGGIGKGYVADLMLASLASKGISRAMISAGGDVVLGDPPPGKEGWKVAILGLERGVLDEVLTLANVAVATSGDLFQSVEIDGVRYSHILSPRTGLGLTQRVAATVIAEDGATSDAVATAACVLGRDGESKLRKIRGIRAIHIKVP